MADIRPPIAAYFDGVFGLTATITPVGGSPVSTKVAWIPTITSRDSVGTGSFGPASVLDGKPRLAVRRDQVPHVKIGSKVEAAELESGTGWVWTVSRVDELDSQVYVLAVTKSVMVTLVGTLSKTLDGIGRLITGTVV